MRNSPGVEYVDDATDRSNEINEVATANEQQTAKVFKITSDLRQLSEEEPRRDFEPNIQVL
ncbi:MAG: hypothetical protein V5A45_00715 [Haloarculaceae archaeon]